MNNLKGGQACFSACPPMAVAFAWLLLLTA
jgi:hypothetical protein